jgi:fructose-specific phosphotransferase system IIC component
MAKPGFEHLMQSYSAEELREIISEPTGWSAYDLQIAASLLAEKTRSQVTVPLNQAETFVPYKLEKIWIILGYLVSLLGASYFFYLAIAGFMAGLVVHQSKKTLKDGSTVKMYSLNSRRHGRNMMILSVLTTCVSLLIAFGVIKNRY